MKKFFSLLFVLCLTSLMLVGMTACGKTSAKKNADPFEKQFVMPRFRIDTDECPDCPENPTRPESPRRHKSKAQRLPKYCENDCTHEKTCTPCKDQR